MTSELRLYYNLDNTKLLHSNDCQYVILTEDMGLFVKKLFNTYPSFIKFSDLCDNDEHVSILQLNYLK